MGLRRPHKGTKLDIKYRQQRLNEQATMEMLLDAQWHPALFMFMRYEPNTQDYRFWDQKGRELTGEAAEKKMAAFRKHASKEFDKNSSLRRTPRGWTGVAKYFT